MPLGGRRYGGALSLRHLDEGEREMEGSAHPTARQGVPG